jgi:ribonuclease HI
VSPPIDDRELPRGVASSPSGPVDVHFDGACEGPAGRRVAAYGYTLEGAGLRHEDAGLAVPPGHPRATNNVAEYVAAICALEWLTGAGYRGEVVLHGDSQLVVRQMGGEYRVRTDHLRPYHERLTQLARQFRTVRFVWVPRSENRRADELSKHGIALGGSAGTPRGPVAGADVDAPDPDDEDVPD